MPKNFVLSNLKVKLRDEIHTTSAALNTDLKPMPFSPMYSPSVFLSALVLRLMAQIASTLSAVKPVSLQSIQRLPGAYEKLNVGVGVSYVLSSAFWMISSRK